MNKKIKFLSNSLDHKALVNNLYSQYGNNQNINIQNLNNDNYSLKQNDEYINYNINPVFQNNRYKIQQDCILPSIKNPKNGKKIKDDKEENNNYLNNDNKSYNMIKEIANNGKKMNTKKSSKKMYLKTNDNHYLIKIIEEQKNKINDLEEKIKQFSRKEEELDKRSLELEEREKMFNNKINFLEDKENIVSKEIKEYENLKKDIDILDQKNKELKEEIKKKKEEFEEFKKNNNKEIEMIEENKKLIQDNSNLKAKIKELEKEIEKLKKNDKKEGKIKLKLKLKENVNFPKNPTLIGLNNIGATCFMNSTLQCLSQTKNLTYYFLNKNNEYRIINNNIALNNKDDLQLSPVYLELIQKLWDENGPKSFSPNKFMNNIEKMNPLFKTGQAGDAKDFIIFILEQIHKELKMPINKNLNLNNLVLNQYDKNNAFYYFLNEFGKECSIISDIFFGFNETTNECLNCKNIYISQGKNSSICYNYGIFNCLIFPLEEVKNMKNNSIQNKGIQNNNNNNNIVSLYDCFCYNQKSELFTGDNKNHCNICNQNFDSIYSSKIYSSPTVLVIILNRGKGNIYNVKLDFCETIDITQFVQQKDCPQLIYNLYGVITHIGESGPNAHFVASCKSPIDKNWYRYNDAFVNSITDLKKEVIDYVH